MASSIFPWVCSGSFSDKVHSARSLTQNPQYCLLAPEAQPCYAQVKSPDSSVVNGLHWTDLSVDHWIVWKSLVKHQRIRLAEPCLVHCQSQHCASVERGAHHRLDLLAHIPYVIHG